LDVVKDVSDFSGEHFGLALGIVRDVSCFFSVEHFRFALDIVRGVSGFFSVEHFELPVDIVRGVSGFSGKHRSRYPEKLKEVSGEELQ